MTTLSKKDQFGRSLPVTKDGNKGQTLIEESLQRPTLSQESFNLLVQTVKKQQFDAEKMTILKTAALGGQLKSHHIAELTKLIGSESSRIDWARFAYDYCLDKENYYLVIDALTFNSSKRELEQYLINKQAK